MAVQFALRRIAVSVQRERPWRGSRGLDRCRAFSDRSGSDIVRMSDEEVTRKALEDAAREDRLDFQTAARLLMSSGQDERKFGWDFHLVQFFFACLPPLAVYAFAQYSRYDQRQMMKDRDARIEKLVEAELGIEVGVELEEVAAMLNSRNPDLEALRLRLEAMEEKLSRLEPALQKTGNSPPNTGNPPPNTAGQATVSPQENKPPILQQEVDRPKTDAAVGVSTSNEKEGEGKSEGYWAWFTGMRRAIFNDASEKTQ
ncbi:hypothetical protein M758_7G171500 [Ceratodon purpureus]|uniref:Uncharacterized protein n=1 Tax=Ceratodon purpureus TaxID=3225 RepID=A0A8T0HCS6_CERPU|nr:hypothetical protein KC19_7G174200 [Ceratodon purpureus]KAG0611866.1 hypothetical protein M758_7G171500 [Ceratodon purpureus]